MPCCHARFSILSNPTNMEDAYFDETPIEKLTKMGLAKLLQSVTSGGPSPKPSCSWKLLVRHLMLMPALVSAVREEL